MATTELAPPAPASGLFARIATPAIRFAGSLLNAYRGHQALAGMLHLDERILRDIGVTEGEIRHVLARTAARHDPTLRLAMIVADRRADAARAAGMPDRRVAKTP